MVDKSYPGLIVVLGDEYFASLCFRVFPMSIPFGLDDCQNVLA
jgi:hypothetical protein